MSSVSTPNTLIIEIMIAWFIADVISLLATGRPPKSQIVIRQLPRVKPREYQLYMGLYKKSKI